MPPRCLALSGIFPKPSTLARKLPSTPRTFTTSSVLYKNPLKRRHGGDLGSHLPKFVIPQHVNIPEYPHGPNELFKQSNRGLYGGKSIQFGNNVSKKTETKTRRYWKPNVLSKSLYSVALKKKIKLRITSSVLKTVDREGGLDEYLLKQSEHRVKELGPLGWALRWTLMQKPAVIQRMRDDAAALGVPQEEIDRQWPATSPVPVEALEHTEEAIIEAFAHSEIEAAEKADKERQRRKSEVKTQAGAEYEQAQHAANRYVKREVVDTAEQGIILACLREKKRAEARAHNLAVFKERLESQLGKKFRSEEAVKEARKAHRRDAKEGNAVASSYEEFKNTEGAARLAELIAQAGGEAAWKAQRKAETLKEIADAENGDFDQSVTEEERIRIQTALSKAKQIIEAEHKQAYAKKRWSIENPIASTDEAEGEPREAPEQSGNASGWDALVQAGEAEAQHRA